MNTLQNFAFVETTQIEDLEKAIVAINQTRHHSVLYKRVICTAPRWGWCAIILDSNDPDHYLLRNISGRLETTVFEFGINGVRLFYRLHKMGRTVSSFESHLALWVNQQLRALLSTGDVMHLDLAEPAGRLVLRRFHEYQRARAWKEPDTEQAIPVALQQSYMGKADDLKDLFVVGATVPYVQEILSPGYAPKTALDRLIGALKLPYLSGDEVTVQSSASGTVRGYTEQNSMRVLKDYDILKPSTWPEGGNLPAGWLIIPRKSWDKENSIA